MKLYSYWRSSAAFRVRIALNLKGLAFEYAPVNLAPSANEQLGEPYMSMNPEGRVPMLEYQGRRLGQSMAILEWLDETFTDPPLLPVDPWDKAGCRAFANTIACDIHPLNNLSVLRKLTHEFGADDAATTRWYHDWIGRGFAALESTAAASTHDFVFGERPTLAEVLLVPQIWNARRFGMDMGRFPALIEIEARCYALPAFENARPENQPDAV